MAMTPSIGALLPAFSAGAARRRRPDIAATLGSFVLSIPLKALWPALPFMDRMGIVFLLALALAVGFSLVKPD